MSQPMHTSGPWPIEISPNWPPYLCGKCFGMCFIYNIRMAQCCYCQHTYLNWSRHEHGSVAPDT